MRLKCALPLLALAGLGACGKPQQTAVNDAAINEAADVAIDRATNAGNAVANAVNAVAQKPTPAPDMPAFDRLGAIRVGATLAELKRDGLVVDRQDEPLDEESTCTFATFKGQPDVSVMLDGERIVRIDVDGKQHETMGGVRVGQSEAEALKRLGGKAVVDPHPYTGPEGHYLVVRDKGAPRGLILETDGQTVESYRFGAWDAVQLIEGCA